MHCDVLGGCLGDDGIITPPNRMMMTSGGQLVYSLRLVCLVYCFLRWQFWHPLHVCYAKGVLRWKGRKRTGKGEHDGNSGLSLDAQMNHQRDGQTLDHTSSVVVDLNEAPMPNAGLNSVSSQTSSLLSTWSLELNYDLTEPESSGCWC